MYAKDDGSVLVSTDINIPLVIDRAPTINEIHQSCTTILKDIQREETVAQTLGMLDMMGRRQMEMMQNAQITQKLGKLK